MHTKTIHSTLVNAEPRIRNETKTCHGLILATTLGQHLVALHIQSMAVPSTNHTKGPQSMHPDTGPPDRFGSKAIHILSVNPNHGCSVTCLGKHITKIKGPCDKIPKLVSLEIGHIFRKQNSRTEHCGKKHLI